MNARLPEHMMRVSIKDMVIGERAYTVPWSVQVDQHGQCWIMGHYAFTHKPFGTSHMRITRTSNGFEIHADNGMRYEQTYVTQEFQNQMGLLPVTKIT